MSSQDQEIFNKTKFEREEYKSAIAEWIESRSVSYTHAVTLNINHIKLQRYIQSAASICSPSDRTLVQELCIENLKTFTRRLAKSLYGNAWKRHKKSFVWIPIVEGFRIGEKLHFHCHLCVDRDRHAGLEEKIKSIWNETPFGSVNVVVENYRDSGWIGYSTKCASPTRLEDIVWDCVIDSHNKDNC
jgi:hypothetical protein